MSLLGQTLAEAERMVRGKPGQLKLALAAVLAGGHVLIEDVPGVGKTTLSHTLARVLGLSYRRIQFTADLVPADILGGAVYDTESRTFTVIKGPIFAQIVLADELNRASPKAQSALLEAMEENQVSLEGEPFPLPRPFVVMATQNPLDMAGTHPLPESQLDRFLVAMTMGYPDQATERALMAGQATRLDYADLQTVLDESTLSACQRQVVEVHLSVPVLDYLQALVGATRQHAAVQLGLSPRAAQGLTRLAQAWALLHERDYVQPDDVQAVFVSVARHRLQTHQGQSGVALAQQILDQTPLQQG